MSKEAKIGYWCLAQVLSRGRNFIANLCSFPSILKSGPIPAPA